MFQNMYLSLFYKTYFFCLRITGFWPFKYDTELKRFKFHSIYLIGPFILIPYVIMAYVLHVDLLLNAVKVLFKTIVLKMISNVYISSNVLNLLFLYITQNSQSKKIRRLIYRTINLYENLCRCLSLDKIDYLSCLIKFAIKSLVFAIIVICYMIVSMTVIAPNVIKFYVLPGFLIPIFINKLYPDIYYGGMLLVDFYLLEINKDLKRILNLPAKISRYDEEIIIDVVEQLDTMSINYIELIEIVKEFNRIMAFRVVLWILIGLMNFLIHLFMEFVFIGIPIRHGHSLNIIISVSGIVDLSYQFLEFWLTSKMCTSVMNKVEETETILSSMYVQLRDNGPFARSVKVSFWCHLK